MIKHKISIKNKIPIKEERISHIEGYVYQKKLCIIFYDYDMATI